MSRESLRRRIDKVERRTVSPLRVAEAIQRVLSGGRPPASPRIASQVERFVRETAEVLDAEDRAALAALGGGDAPCLG